MNTALWLLLPALIGCSDDPTPVGRYSHIGAVSGDGSRLFIAGGSDGPTKLVDAWSFDLSEHRWTPEAPIPQASHRAIAVGLDEDQALVYGGTSWEEEETSDVHKWNLLTGTWELSQEDAPGPRYKHAAATDGERIWVMGGRNNDGDEPVVYDELWVRDGSGAWRSLPMQGTRPASRRCCTTRAGRACLRRWGGAPPTRAARRCRRRRRCSLSGCTATRA